MGGSIFGLGSSLNVQAASISLIAIVAFTVIFELGTHKLDHHLEGSPYKEMVDKIYKELTILGFISFGVFMFIQSEAEVDQDIFLAFEFSHIVIFFAALFFIIEAFFLMALNQKLKTNIDMAVALSSEDMLKRFGTEKNAMNKKSRWMPFQNVSDKYEINDGFIVLCCFVSVCFVCFVLIFSVSLRKCAYK